MLRTIAAFERIGEENAFAVLARANALAARGREIINLGIGQPDFRTPDFIVEAAVKALRDGHHGYTPAVGIPALREAVAADLYKRFKVSVSPDEVMIQPGGKPTMFMAILMFGEPGTDILYPDPGFPIYRSMIEFTGANPIPVPIREENGFAFSAEETLALITPRTRLLIVNSPANPTAGAWSWSSASTGCRASPAPRPRARSTPFPTSSAPAGVPRRSRPHCSTTPASPSSAAPISASWARDSCGCRTPIRPRTSCRHS